MFQSPVTFLRSVGLALLLAGFALQPALSGSAAAGETKVGALIVTDAWARASIGAGKAGAAYLSVTNEGEEVDRLISASTSVSRKTGLHTHVMDGSVMKMRPVEAIEVAPGTPTVLQPGGLHVMLMGLEKPLQEGETFPLTLTFEKAGKVEVQVQVMSPTHMGGMQQMKHGS